MLWKSIDLVMSGFDKLFYLCVQSPPRPVSQEQILPHVTLDDSNSNSNEKNDQFYNFVPKLKKLVC